MIPYVSCSIKNVAGQFRMQGVFDIGVSRLCALRLPLFHLCACMHYFGSKFVDGAFTSVWRIAVSCAFAGFWLFVMDATSRDDARKLQFTLNAVTNDLDPLHGEAAVPEEVRAALDWIAATPPDEVERSREVTLREFEARAESFRCILSFHLVAVHCVFFIGAGQMGKPRPGSRVVAHRSGASLRMCVARC